MNSDSKTSICEAVILTLWRLAQRQEDPRRSLVISLVLDLGKNHLSRDEGNPVIGKSVGQPALCMCPGTHICVYIPCALCHI